MRNLLSVMNIKGLKQVLYEGGTIELLANEDVDSSKPNWVGSWQLFGIKKHNGDRSVLVYQESLEPKIIKTAVSAMQHCKKLGFKTAKIPLYKGEFTTFTKEDCNEDGDSK